MFFPSRPSACGKTFPTGRLVYANAGRKRRYGDGRGHNRRGDTGQSRRIQSGKRTEKSAARRVLPAWTRGSWEKQWPTAWRTWHARVSSLETLHCWPFPILNFLTPLFRSFSLLPGGSCASPRNSRRLLRGARATGVLAHTNTGAQWGRPPVVEYRPL